MRFVDVENVLESEVKKIAKLYSTLDYPVKLATLLQRVYPKADFSKAKKFDLHQIINATLLKNYSGEARIKYALFENYATKNVVGAFEIPVYNSRADFLTINGTTTNFEIKSNLDSLTKLRKQAADYEATFENNIIGFQLFLIKVLLNIFA